MKTIKILSLLALLLIGNVETFGQKLSKPKAPKALKSYPQDTVATRAWVREYLSEAPKPETPILPVPTIPHIEPDRTAPVLPKPDCKTGLDLVAAKYDNGQIEFSFRRSMFKTLTGWLRGQKPYEATRVNLPPHALPFRWTSHRETMNCR